MRSEYLDSLRGRGIFATYYDPDGERFGIPTFPFHFAPKGLATIRQLRAKGLRPGGQEIAAQILWRHRRQQRVAYLYDEKKAKPKRTATPAQREAIQKALDARKTCPCCGVTRDYYIPKSRGECNPCADGWRAEPDADDSNSWPDPETEKTKEREMDTNEKAADPGRSGAEAAQQVISAQANSGMSPDRMARHHHDTTTWLYSQATTPEAQRYADGYAWTAETLLTELRQADPEREAEAC